MERWHVYETSCLIGDRRSFLGDGALFRCVAAASACERAFRSTNENPAKGSPHHLGLGVLERLPIGPTSTVGPSSIQPTPAALFQILEEAKAGAVSRAVSIWGSQRDQSVPCVLCTACLRFMRPVMCCVRWLPVMPSCQPSF